MKMMKIKELIAMYGIVLVLLIIISIHATRAVDIPDTPTSPFSEINRNSEVKNDGKRKLLGDNDFGEISDELRQSLMDYLHAPLKTASTSEKRPQQAQRQSPTKDSPQRFYPGFPLDAIIPKFPTDIFFQDYESKYEYLTERIPIDEETYDYIVVGGGATGCTAAQALSRIGATPKVLVIERGMERSYDTTPNAMDIQGAGIGLADGTISQPVGSIQGVRTFTGAVMGGGSAVNLGIMIGENEDWFEAMSEEFPGFNINYGRLQNYYEYVQSLSMTPMPTLEPFGPAFSNALLGSGYTPIERGSPAPPAAFPVMGAQWKGYSLFDANNNFYRNSSDIFLWNSPNVTIQTRSFVRRVTFEDTTVGPTADCVVYNPTMYKDVQPIGNLWSLFPSSAADWAPWIGTFLNPKSVLVAANLDHPNIKLRRVCLTDPTRGKIVLSAGAIHTPLILYRSGIGPRAQVALLKSPLVVDNPDVGSMFSDRVFIAVPGFLAHYSDEVSFLPVDSLMPIRRLGANEDTKNKKIKKLRRKLTSEDDVDDDHHQNDEILVVDESNDELDSRFLFNPPTLLPDFALFPGKMGSMAGELQPRVCQFMGLKQIGTECTAGAINDPNLKCSVVPIQELSGDRTAEGFIYASRFIFPPAFRVDPILDALVEFLQSCSNYRNPFGLIFLKPLCTLAQPVIKCFRKALAPFYFTSEPKSRGSIRLKPTGEVVMDPKYLVDEEDLFDAVRGVSTLIDQINSDAYQGILQPDGPLSCPLAVANGLLDILLAIGSTTSPFLTNSQNFGAIQQYLQDLIPPSGRRLRRLMVINDQTKPEIYEDENGKEYHDYSKYIVENVDEDKMEKLGVKRRLQEVGFDFKSYKSHMLGEDSSPDAPHRRLESSLDEIVRNTLDNNKLRKLKEIAEEARDERLRKLSKEDPILLDAINECKKDCINIPMTECARRDICCANYGNSKCIKTPGTSELPNGNSNEIYSMRDAAPERGHMKSEEFFFNTLLFPWMGLEPSYQWAASYPPKLPSSSNPKAVAKFALTYMTSIGHVYGSAPMGRVVDDNFNVFGVSGLSIADASILPQLTRMNPTFTLMALGGYAANLIATTPAVPQ